MTNRGKKPYEKSPTDPGPAQTTRVAAEYPDMPDECDDLVTRVSKAKYQKKINGKWRYLGASWNFRGNDEGLGWLVKIENGHGVSDLVYWKPGDNYRVLVQSTVKDDETKEVIGSKTRPIPIQARR